MSAATSRPEFFIALAKRPLRRGAPGWASVATSQRAKEALQQALDTVFTMPQAAPAIPAFDAAALAAALTGAIPAGRWTLKAAKHQGAIVGKF